MSRQAGALGGPGSPPGEASAAPPLEGAARPGRHYTAVGWGASLRVPEGVPAADAPGEETAPPQSALCSALPPGAGTNGLAAAEVICQAAPGVRPREEAARAGGADAGGGRCVRAH